MNRRFRFMNPLFPSRCRALAGAFFVFAAPLLDGATLRVPEDFALVQRAIVAAAPNDTIAIAAGTYRENIFIDKPLTLRGAGADKTTILAPNRQLAIARIERYGPVTLTDLAFAHAPQTLAKEPSVASYAVDVDEADLVLRNVRLLRSAGYGIQCAGNAVSIENVAISGTPFSGLSLVHTRPGVRVTNLSMDADTQNQHLHLEGVVGTLKDVKLVMDQHAEIQIWDSTTAAKFENFPAEHFAKIRWLSGASPDGPKPPEPDSLTATRIREREELRTFLKENRAEHFDSAGKRSAAARELQKALRAASSSNTPAAPAEQPAHKAALIAYVRSVADIDGVDFNWDSRTLPILGELSAYHDRFGPLALEELLRELPGKDAEKNMAENYVRYLPAFLSAPLDEARAKKSLASSFDLPAVLATWKTANGKDPRAAANGFAEVVKTVSQKADASSAGEKQILKAAVLAEISPFIEARGYAAFSALLDALAAKPVALLSADDVRAVLSPQQKRAFAKHLISE
jgi:hypothetical protein